MKSSSLSKDPLLSDWKMPKMHSESFSKEMRNKCSNSEGNFKRQNSNGKEDLINKYRPKTGR